MRFTIERAAALAAMNRVAGVVPDKHNSAILTHVLIEAFADGAVMFRGSNYDLEATASAEAMVSDAGAITVPAAALHNIVKGAAKGADLLFELEHAPTILLVKSGRSRFKLFTLPAADFPAFSSNDWPVGFDIMAATLADLLERPRFAAAPAKDQVKAHLGGVHLAALGDEMHAVAMQGYQFIKIKADRPDSWLEDFGVTIPHALLDQFLPVLTAKKGADVRLYLSKNKASIIADRVQITGRLIDGKYVDYEGILARYTSMMDRELTVGREALTAAIKRALSVMLAKDQGVKLSASADAITITSRADIGNAEDVVATEMEGDDVALGFNAPFLLGVLNAMAGETVTIRFRDGESSTQFLDPADPDTILFAGQRRV